MPIWKNYYRKNLFGGGMVINRDQAGDSKFGTTQVNLSFSYIRSINKINNQIVSFGIQLGAAQRNIDYSKLVFDNQYNGSSFNPAIPNNEDFQKSNFLFFDLSSGATWNYLMPHKQHINFGLSLFHINKPKQSFFNDNNIRLDRKFVFHGNSQIMASPTLFVLPGILVMQQGKYNEIDIGSLVKIIKESENINYLALQFGLYYRVGDAVNLIAGVDYNDFSFGVSYDLNLSKLIPASNARGGFELSLVYIVNKSKKTYVKKISCPIF